MELGLIQADDVLDARVVPLRKAYPLYVGDYEGRLTTILDYLSRFKNLQTAGRNGLFRYTSGDHYIEMGMKAAQNILGGAHDLRAVAAAPVYAES